MTPASRYVAAISLEPLDASTTLFLGHLADRLAGALQVVPYNDSQTADVISGASALILVRGLFEFDAAVWSARALGIPLYYFVDDNFILLREQPGPWSPYVGRYSAASVRRQLRHFQGVLLSSQTLIDYFKSEQLHRELMLFPPVEWREQLPKPPDRSAAVTVAFFGGRHLHDVFRSGILPAVRRLAAERPVTLIAAGVSDALAPSPGLTVVGQPYDASYERGLRRLAEAGIDVFVHPSAPGLLNDRYKNPHALISAKALAAIPVVSNRPPYSDLAPDGVAVLCDDSPESWYAGLVQALQPAEALAIAERLTAFCASRYGGQVNREAIVSMLGRHQPPSGRWTAVRSSVVRILSLFSFLFTVIRQALKRLWQGAARAESAGV